MTTPAEIGELVAKAFDQLNDECQGFKAMDAVLLIELAPSEPVEDGAIAYGDIIWGSTSDRTVVVAGILQMASRLDRRGRR